ncbi:MAG: hypothetical protein M1824_003946 [Vezdaea acicularis]|nr:MAG: hypothetical protein M1824_003946 [Vezdaea acicularis]
MDSPTARKLTFHEITHLLRLQQKPSLNVRVWMWLAGLNQDHPDSPDARLEIDLTVVPVVDLTDGMDEEMDMDTDMDAEVDMEMVESGYSSSYYYYYCSDERVAGVTISSAERAEAVTISSADRAEVVTISSSDSSGDDDDGSSGLDERVGDAAPDVITISSGSEDSEDESSDGLDERVVDGSREVITISSDSSDSSDDSDGDSIPPSQTPPSKPPSSSRAYHKADLHRAPSPLALSPHTPFNASSYLGPGLKVCLLVLAKMLRRYRLAGEDLEDDPRVGRVGPGEAFGGGEVGFG